MKKKIHFFNLDNYTLVSLNENNENIKLLIDANSEKKYIGVYYKSISKELQDIIDKSFDYLDPTVLYPIGYFLENEEKDLVLIYNSLQIFSVKDYMTRDFLVAFKVALGTCHSLLIYDKFINFKLSLILIDLQSEPRLLPFFNIQSKDKNEEKTNLNEYVNNIIININKRYEILINSDFFLTPFHQIILDIKLDKATFQTDTDPNLNIISTKSDTFSFITLQSIYSSFLNDLVPNNIDLRRYNGQIHFIKSTFAQKTNFYSIFQQKNSPFSCLETVFFNKPILIDRSIFDLKPEDYLNFALIYLKGEIVSKNIDSALKLLTKATCLGETWFYIAICCLSDEKGNDREAAKKYFKLGADKGHAESAFNYAKLTNSVDYFLKAAEGGVKDAFYQISRIYLEDGDAENATEFAKIGAERFNDVQCIKNLELIDYSLKMQEEKLMKEMERLAKLREKSKKNEEEEEEECNDVDSSENENQIENENKEINEDEIQNDQNIIENQNKKEKNNENLVQNGETIENKDKNEEINENFNQNDETIENNIQKNDQKIIENQVKNEEINEIFNQNDDTIENKDKNEEINENPIHCDDTIENKDKNEEINENPIHCDDTIENQDKNEENSKNMIRNDEIIENKDQKDQEERMETQKTEKTENINQKQNQEENNDIFPKEEEEPTNEENEEQNETIKSFTQKEKSSEKHEIIKDQNEAEKEIQTEEEDSQKVSPKFELFEPNNGQSKFESIISQYKDMSIDSLLHQTLFIPNLIHRSCVYCFIAFKFLEVSEKDASRFYFEKSIDNMNCFTTEYEYKTNNDNRIEFTDDHLLNTTDYSSFDKDLISFILSLSNYSLFKITGERMFLIESDYFPDISYELYKTTRNKEYLIKAAKMGHLKSLHKIGKIKEAADLGHSKSQFEYSKQILMRSEDESDFKLAASYMKMAADSSMKMINFSEKKGEIFFDHFLSLLNGKETETEPSKVDASFYSFEYSKLIEKKNRDESLKYLKMSAELNANSDSMLKYGLFLKTEKNDTESFISYLKKSAASGSADAYFLLSKHIMMNRGESEETLEKLNDLLNCENTKFNGSQNDIRNQLKSKVVSFLFAASRLGSSDANLCLSRMFMNGFCVRKNEQESARLLKLAAKNEKNIEAKYQLAITTGNDKLLHQCCTEMYVPAILEMGKREIHSSNSQTKKEGEKKLRYLSDNFCGCKMAQKEAQFELGSFFFARQQYAESFTYLSRSIEYKHGSTTKTAEIQLNDDRNKRPPFTKSYKTVALKMLASMLLNGLGVKTDIDEATLIYEAVFDDESRLQLAKIYMGSSPEHSLAILNGIEKKSHESLMLSSILELKVKNEKNHGKSDAEIIDLNRLIKGKINRPNDDGFLHFFSNGQQFNQAEFTEELNKNGFYYMPSKPQSGAVFSTPNLSFTNFVQSQIGPPLNLVRERDETSENEDFELTTLRQRDAVRGDFDGDEENQRPNMHRIINERLYGEEEEYEFVGHEEEEEFIDSEENDFFLEYETDEQPNIIHSNRPSIISSDEDDAQNQNDEIVFTDSNEEEGIHNHDFVNTYVNEHEHYFTPRAYTSEERDTLSSHTSSSSHSHSDIIISSDENDFTRCRRFTTTINSLRLNDIAASTTNSDSNNNINDNDNDNDDDDNNSTGSDLYRTYQAANDGDSRSSFSRRPFYNDDEEEDLFDIPNELIHPPTRGLFRFSSSFSEENEGENEGQINNTHMRRRTNQRNSHVLSVSLPRLPIPQRAAQRENNVSPAHHGGDKKPNDQISSEKVHPIEWTSSSGTECSRLLDIYSRISATGKTNENSGNNNESSIINNDDDDDEDDIPRRSRRRMAFRYHLSDESDDGSEESHSHHYRSRSSESLGSEEPRSPVQYDGEEEDYFEFEEAEEEFEPEIMTSD